MCNLRSTATLSSMNAQPLGPWRLIYVHIFYAVYTNLLIAFLERMSANSDDQFGIINQQQHLAFNHHPRHLSLAPPPPITTIPNSHCHSLPPSTAYNHGTQPTMEQPMAMWQHHVTSHNDHQHPGEYPPHSSQPTLLTHSTTTDRWRGTRMMTAEVRKTQDKEPQHKDNMWGWQQWGGANVEWWHDQDMTRDNNERRLVARSLLSPWYSAGLVSEFDIPAESAWNIMGIVFLLLCLVIPYRVRPKSVKKKLNSIERLVDFHGTSPRSSCEIIHVMISCANLNMWDSFPNKQTMFVWQSLSSHHHHLFFPPPPTMLFTTTHHTLHHHHPRDRPQMPMTTNDHTATTTAQKTKPATHKRRRPPTYDHPPWVVNDDQQPHTDTGNDEPRWVSSPPPPNISNTGATLCNQMIHNNEGTAMTATWDNDKEGMRQWHGEDTQWRWGHMMRMTCDDHHPEMVRWGHTTTTHKQYDEPPAPPPMKNDEPPAAPSMHDDEPPAPHTVNEGPKPNDNEGPTAPGMNSNEGPTPPCTNSEWGPTPPLMNSNKGPSPLAMNGNEGPTPPATKACPPHCPLSPFLTYWLD